METVTKVNPHMITIAREARGLVQLELAEQLEVSKPTAWRWEHEEFAISDDVIEKLSKTLHFPESFFYQKGEALPLSLSYRKRNVVAAKLISQIEANINITRLNIEQLLPAMGYDNIKLPVLDVTKYGTPQECAKQLRKVWKVEKGVLTDLSALLEQNKILLVKLDFGTERVDGRCTIALDKFPTIVTNKSLLGDRQRFTLAYELGHLVMHLYTSPKYDRDLSHEANLFAAELLMPEKEIKNDLLDLSLPKLGELKKKWKVSMQALLYRASDLELISDNQKRYLLQQFNQQHIRRREPKELDIPTENYRLVRDLLTQYRTKQRLSISKMASFLNLEEDDFLTRYNN
jgi:Zn-dependent peptidase ImmA (M78 family)/DNA-binding XRE family transcriptional regulator